MICSRSGFTASFCISSDFCILSTSSRAASLPFCFLFSSSSSGWRATSTNSNHLTRNSLTSSGVKCCMESSMTPSPSLLLPRYPAYLDVIRNLERTNFCHALSIHAQVFIRAFSFATSSSPSRSTPPRPSSRRSLKALSEISYSSNLHILFIKWIKSSLSGSLSSRKGAKNGMGVSSIPSISSPFPSASETRIYFKRVVLPEPGSPRITISFTLCLAAALNAALISREDNPSSRTFSSISFLPLRVKS